MFEFVQTHWVEIGGIAALVILLGERVARLTPTETDNKIFKALRRLAQVVSIDVPDNPGNPK